jgi:hypothetical protein
VRVGGVWLPVAHPEMDCAIVIDDGGRADRRAVRRQRGDQVVVGHRGRQGLDAAARAPQSRVRVHG